MAPMRRRSRLSSPSTSSARARRIQAVHYWQQTGDNAVRQNAYPEAITALRKGIALLATLPESPERSQHELALQLTLAELLMGAKGMASPEAGDAYSRAHALCQQVGETPQRFRVLSGLSLFHGAQARWRTGGEFSQQLFNLSQCQHDPVLVREGHVLMGAIALYRGDLVVARVHLEQNLELSAAEPPLTHIFVAGLHPRIASLVWLMRTLWVLGYTDQAQQRSQVTLALARQAGHTPSLAFRNILSPCSTSAAETS